MAKRIVNPARAELVRRLIQEDGITDTTTLVKALREAGYPVDRSYVNRAKYTLRQRAKAATAKKTSKPKAAKPKAAAAAKPPVAAAQPSPRVRSRVVQGSVEDKTLKKLQMIRDVQQAVGGKRAFRKLLAFLDRLDTAKD